MLRSLGQLVQFAIGGLIGLIAFQFFLGNEPRASNGVLTDAEIERNFSDLPDDAGAVYFAVKEYFPEDAEFWRDEIRRIAKTTRSAQAAEMQIYNVGATIRKRHAASLRHATGPDLNRVIAQQADLVRPFRSESQLCNTLLMRGPMALPPPQRERIATQLAKARVLYRTMHAAQKRPVQRSDPTDKAWSELFDLYLSKGFSPDDIDLVVSPNESNPRLCNAMLGFFEVLRGATFPGSDAIKAEFAVALVSS